MADKKTEEQKAEENDDPVATQPAPESETSSDTSSSDSTSDDGGDEEEPIFVEDPAFDVNYKGECAYEVGVSVPPANFEKESEKLLNELKNDAEIPGFRPGRAPRKLVENKFGKHVRSEVEAKLVSAAFQRVLEEEELRPLALPDVDGLEELKDRATDQPLEFTLKFEVLPRAELGDYAKIEVERPTVKLKKKDVDEAIEDLLERQATFEPLEEGKAEDGDQVIIDFQGVIDGEPFEGGSANDYPYVLGTKRFFEEFEEALAGAQSGDTVECDVPMPEDLPNEAIAGRTAHFTINVKEVKRKQTPSLDDEFAKSFGYESADELREKVEENLSRGANQQGDQIAQSRAVEKLVEISTFEIPKTMVQAAAEDAYQEERRRLMSEGMETKELDEKEQDIRKQAEERAIDDIKRVVAVNRLGEKEGVVVTEEDFESEIAGLAEQTGLQHEAVARYFAEEENRNRTEDRIYRNKAIEALMAKVNVKDVELKDEDELKEQYNEEVEKTDAE